MDKEKIELLLNCNTKLRENIKKFIEIFVLYYGEEERSHIEELFNNTQYIGYYNDNEIKNVNNELIEIESERLQLEIINNTTLPVSKEILFDRYSMENETLFPLYTYLNFLKEGKLSKEERENNYYKQNYNALAQQVKIIPWEEYIYIAKSKKFPPKYEKLSEKAKEFILDYTDISIKQKNYERKKEKAVEFLKQLYPHITIDNIEQEINNLKEINKIIEHYNINKQKLEKFKEELPTLKIEKYNEKVKETLNKEYYLKYIKEIIDIVPEKYKDELLKITNNPDKYINLSRELESIIGYSLNNTPAIEYFSEEEEEKLNNPNTKDWEKDTIKRNRISYFKAIGINLGNDYEEYKNHMHLIPSKELIKKLQNIRDRINKELSKEYYNNNIIYKEIIEEIKKIGYKYDSTEEDIKGFEKGSICVNPNRIYQNGKYILKPMMKIKFSLRDIDELDHFIIHELNHVYELSLIKAEEENAEYISGWDLLNEKEDEEEEKKRKYELLNEAINETIAKEISQIMEENNIRIFKTSKKEKNHTGYDRMLLITDDFFQTFKKEIIASRKNNNIKILLDAIGKENFEEFNDLLNEFYYNFNEFKVYKIMTDIKQSKETEETKKYKDIFNRKELILEKMQRYYNNKKHER